MTFQQVELFFLLAAIFGFLLWGRLRHDLIAAGGLFIAVVLGLVPEARAFEGFSNPAVIVVALVLIMSRAFENSGALGLITAKLVSAKRSISTHIVMIGGIGAALSAFMNNVAALAVLMPIDMQAARRAGRPPGATLMPLAFATVLGGVVTMIGTPPNIIVSGFREKVLGQPYQMFDFAPVGLIVAAAGLIYVALVGWRFIPGVRNEQVQEMHEEEFLAELVVPEDSSPVGKLVVELDDEAEHADVIIVGLVRDGARLPRRARFARIGAGDVLLVEGATDGIANFMKALGLVRSEDETGFEEASEAEGAPARRNKPMLAKAVVRNHSRIVGNSAEDFRLRSHFGVTLLGISRRGEIYREELGKRKISAGDLLLLFGPRSSLDHVVDWLDLLPVNETSVEPPKVWRIAVAVGFLAAAVFVASMGWLSLTIAIAIAVAGYAVTGLIPPREFYDDIDWSVVVMLACLLPLGSAFEALGASTLVAKGLLGLADGTSAVFALILMMVVVMLLSDILDNVATIIMAGPIAIEMAKKLGANPDTFLMGACIACSCAFLTPIGHKNNMLVMGPGGYAFSDYWRLGLPLEVIVMIVSVPSILIFWPL